MRDGLRWHLIETSPGVYDWTSLISQLDGAIATGTQVLWDLCHWGIPDGLDPFSPEFITRFAAFSSAAATFIRARYDQADVLGPAFFCPVNEISFWAWVGGDEQHFFPFAADRGPDLKRQLVRASVAAIRAVRAVDPTARFIQPEPIIRIVADPTRPEDALVAATHSNAQFEAWDMIAGRTSPELGGAEDLLDLIGVNFYWNNEWIHEGDRTPPGHGLHRPLHTMLVDLWKRYNRSILITETGTESDVAVGWFGYICAELRQAQRLGVPIFGACIYPVTDYPGWDDNRHCPCGLLELDATYTIRSVRSDLFHELSLQQKLFSNG